MSKLIELLSGHGTLGAVFNQLHEKSIKIWSIDEFEVVEPKELYAIVKLKTVDKELIHPYGTTIGYEIKGIE
jgi:hypothetical protein